MTTIQLPSYLKMYRKRTGLTHEEVAFLLGSMSGASVSRHENGARLPILRTALKYQAIFGQALCELYPGIFDEARELVRKRARGLRLSLEKRPRNAVRDRKIEILTGIIGEEVDKAA